ncbi:MAG TPA: hypothetical protein DEP66_03870 [Acidimicrobiaceae bacterium]|nr:hypothetical protein [Acidimicrobiaceae bacterium]
MDAALDAATTSAPLTARPVAVPGTSTVTVFFSEPVTDDPPAPDGAVAGHDAKNPAHYSVAGGGLLAADTLSMSGRVLTIELGDYLLRAGDTIGVADAAVKGVGDDNRTVRGTQVTIAERKPDGVRPRVSLAVAHNAPAVVVLVEEENPFGAQSRALTAADVSVERADATPVPTAPGAVAVSDDGLRYSVELADGARLRAGDVVLVRAGAVGDADGNLNRSLRVVVGANSDAPRVLVATVTAPRTVVEAGLDTIAGTDDDVSHDAALALARGADGAWSACAPDDACVPEFGLAARAVGRESGVAGNEWNFDFVYSGDGAGNGPAEVTASVTASTSRTSIAVAYDDDARVSDVVAALRADDTVVSRFEITDANDAGDPLVGPPVPGGASSFRFTGGVGSVELVLTYNDLLQSFGQIAAAGAATGTACPAPPAGGLLRDAQTDDAWTGRSDDDPAGYIAWDVDFDPPARTVVVALTSSSGPLPTAGLSLVLPAGLAVNYDCAASAAVAGRTVRTAG